MTPKGGSDSNFVRFCLVQHSFILQAPPEKMGQWHESREKVVTENLSKVKTVDYWGERVPVAWETLPRGVCVGPRVVGVGL